MIETEQALWIFGAILQTVGALFGLAVLVYIFWYDKTRSQFREESIRIQSRAVVEEMTQYGATRITLFFRKPGKKPEVEVDITKATTPKWQLPLIESGGRPLAAPDPMESIRGGFVDLSRSVVSGARRALGLTLGLGLLTSAGALAGFVYARSVEREVLGWFVILSFATMLLSMTWFSFRYLVEGAVGWLYRGQKDGNTYIGYSD